METTYIIAKVLGVYFAVSGVFIIMRGKTLSILLRDLFENKAITFITGALLVIGGASLVMRKDTGIGAMTSLVTFIGWLILIKGIMYILVPDWLKMIGSRMIRFATVPLGFVLAFFGLYLLFI